ncbi:MAG: hypothetical protein ACM34H_10415, partial [Deltaproteobacteria bacterium]
LILKYLATLRGKTWNPKELSPKPLKGVGTFLVAGVWMLWKNDMPGLREIALMDAEVGARQFYEAIRFEPRGLSGYVLKMPRGYLLRSILTMSHHCRHLRPELIHDLNKLTAKEVRRLRKKSKADQVLSRLGAAISAMQDRLESERQDEPSESAGLQTLQIQSWGAWQNDCYG